MSLDSGKTDDKARMLSQGDGILTMLETYAADLENPGKTLKQMAPLVEAIDHEVTRLEEKANARFSRDEALMDWVNELSLTARVATVKFHRGDFL
jgi:glycyl-tRNA synthetase beta subunit